MKITAAISIQGLAPAPGSLQTAVATQPCPADRVSTSDLHRAADVARGVQAKGAELRLVRLAHIGEAIHAGTYQPSASQVASRILDAAEIDEHLRAILADSVR
jgi:hypothetical protein